MKREARLIRFPTCPTERAILSVIANWHYAGFLQELRDEKQTEAK